MLGADTLSHWCGYTLTRIYRLLFYSLPKNEVFPVEKAIPGKEVAAAATLSWEEEEED